MPTVSEVLKRIERINKDLDYVRSLQVKWSDQRKRFPQIFQGMVAQERSFTEMIDALRRIEIVDASLLGDVDPARETASSKEGSEEDLDSIADDPDEIELDGDEEKGVLVGAGNGSSAPQRDRRR